MNRPPPTEQQALFTVWDDNEYIQCRVMLDQSQRCEAAGSLMQPSLSHVLLPERLRRLAALGWRLDPSFGNYVRDFPMQARPEQIAPVLLTSLEQGYDARASELEFENEWVAREACPPRNGPGQNLAGWIDDARSMAAFVVHACFYKPAAPKPPVVWHPYSAAELIHIYGRDATFEMAWLRSNSGRQRVFAIFDTPVGYVQCESDKTPHAIYCEAVSADTWPEVAAMLTPDRIAHLHAAGFTDPGRTQNYSRLYGVHDLDDADIANALLTILHDVYGYDGATPITLQTEAGRMPLSQPTD